MDGSVELTWPGEGKREQLSAAMDRLRVPAVSIAVVEGGAPTAAAAIGRANAGLVTVVTPDTLFQAASISKPVTALAVLRLVQEGALSLDDDVREHLRSWRLPFFIDGPSRVTVRLLLSHRAGVTVGGFEGYAPWQQRPSLRQILNADPPCNSPPIFVDCRPGGACRYSGGGYVLLQKMLGDLTGLEFADLMAQMVLRPLGMARSSFCQPLPEHLADEAAAGHTEDGRPVPGRWHVYPELAAAGLWTTPLDLARMVADIQAALAGEEGRLLRPHMAREFARPVGAGLYGLGCAVSEDGTRFSHSGSNEGYACIFEAHVSGGWGVVVMTNSDGGGALMRALLHALTPGSGVRDR